VPAAAALSSPEARGKTVGRVMTGLLLGILLSRVVSGTVAQHFGWRAVFLGGSVVVAVLCVVSRALLPAFAATTTESYVTLLGSLLRLFRQHRALRRAALAQGFLSFAFSGFWSTLALALAAPPYGFGSMIAGTFGLAGAAGALAAPLAGGLADRRGPLPVIRLGAVLVAVSFAFMALLQGRVWVLVLGAIVFDMGVQASLVAHQTIVYGLDPSARSRLNAVLISSMFVGMSSGAALASHAFDRAGFRPVLVLCGAVASLALVVQRPRK
jgi:predicted MFS family arabinose efflux permease